MHGDTVFLSLVRHAEAAAVGDGVRTDAERPLTTRGVEEAAAAGRLLARMDHPPALILVSPYRRAVQTGEIIGGALEPPVAVTRCEVLQPGFRNADLLEELVALRRIGHEHILAVGHQPDIGVLMNFLIAGAAPTSVAIAPGTIIRIHLKVSGGRPEGVLQWLLPPSAVRSVLVTSTEAQRKP
jgi:phosphohistidine phosphatase